MERVPSTLEFAEKDPGAAALVALVSSPASSLKSLLSPSLLLSDQRLQLVPAFSPHSCVPPLLFYAQDQSWAGFITLPRLQSQVRAAGAAPEGFVSPRLDGCGVQGNPFPFSKRKINHVLGFYHYAVFFFFLFLKSGGSS